MVTICTFNANNPFVRYRFGDRFPGAPANLAGPARTRRPRHNQQHQVRFLSTYQPASFEVFTAAPRELAARALRRAATIPCPTWWCCRRSSR